MCDGQRVEGKWGAVGPEEVMRSDTVLMQDLDSSHGEVALSGAAMMTTTQSAGLSAAVVEWSDGVCVCLCVCVAGNE